MRAAYYRTYGPARAVLEIGELPDPVPGPGEVRVRMKFSGINPSDCNRRAGIRDRPGYPLIIPHSDGAGEIDAVGEGVPPERIGEPVWIWNAQRARPFGTAAEYVALPSRQAVRLPAGVMLADGASLGVPGMTAYFSLLADGPLDGRDVLVTGGAGAVGFYAVQIARLAGARTVVTTVSSEEKARIAAAAGAEVIINYRTEDVAERVMQTTGGRGVDRISEVDFGGNLAITLKVIQPDCAIGAYASKGRARAGIAVLSAAVQQRGRALHPVLHHARCAARLRDPRRRSLVCGRRVDASAETNPAARRHRYGARDGRAGRFRRQGDAEHLTHEPGCKCSVALRPGSAGFRAAGRSA
jgi:NADPH:quinone reductase